MDCYELTNRYIENGDIKQLIITLETITISDLDDFIIYSKNLIKKVFDVEKFTSSNIRKILLTLENRQKSYLRKSCLNQLLDFIRTNQFNKYTARKNVIK